MHAAFDTDRIPKRILLSDKSALSVIRIPDTDKPYFAVMRQDGNGATAGIKVTFTDDPGELQNTVNGIASEIPAEIAEIRYQ